MQNSRIRPRFLRRPLVVSGGLAFCLALSLRAEAALVILPSAPASVLEGVLESNTDAFIFHESTTTLAAPMSVDISTPGLYNLANPDSPGAIPASTVVSSYFLHRDSVNEELSTVTVFGTFPQEVLGIIIEDENLDASDPILGAPGTLYPTGLDFRGLEVPYLSLADVVFWSGNMVFISVQSTTAEVLDQVRIITAVPEPGSLALGLAAAPVAWWSWRRRRSA